MDPALENASDYLMAPTALAVVLKRARGGGSWDVQVVLARTGRSNVVLGLHRSLRSRLLPRLDVYVLK